MQPSELILPTAPATSAAAENAASAAVFAGSCGHENSLQARFCAHCGIPLFAAQNGEPKTSAPSGPPGAEAYKFADLAGLTGLPAMPSLRRFSVADLLSDVFKRRSPDELEEHLLAGTLRATPPVVQMQADWPRPWLFARVFLFSLLLYAIFYSGWLVFGNTNLLPAVMMIGSFAVPFAAVLLFYEFNTPRNVSLLLVLRLVTLGGAWSLMISLLLFQLGSALSSWLGASAAGLIEEVGKLMAVLFATRRLSPVRYRYTLNGLLFGAAVGAGFAAFESAGYALNQLLQTRSSDAMTNLILLRGVLAPFGHVVWTALAAGALWRVKGALSLSGPMLADGRFLRIFAVSMLCHIVWNSPLVIGHWTVKYVGLGFVAWAVALSLVQDGLMQIRREQASLGLMQR